MRRSVGSASRRGSQALFGSLVMAAGLMAPRVTLTQEMPPQQAQETPLRPAPPEEALPPQQETTRKKLLLIGIDGVRPDILAEVGTPVLDSLIANGAYSDSAYTTRPTISGPGWSSMLTGVWPTKHAVLTNSFQRNRYEQYPDFLTRIERVRPELETFVVADWLPLVSEDSGGPLFGDGPDVKVVLDGYKLGWAEADELAVDAAVEQLRTADPDALFVYLGNPDEASHQAGSIGEEYRDAIELADRQVGRLLDAVRARPTFGEENWLIMISTDHGRRADGGHGRDSPEEKTIFVLVSGPSAMGGRIAGTPAIVDVAATALAHLGIRVDPEWGLDGTPVGVAERP